MALEDMVEMPGHLIRRAQQIAVARFLEECIGFGLTPVQYAALVCLHDVPGTDATRLAAQIAFDRSTIGNVIERMEAKGWIERYVSPADRRAKLLRLTSAGEALLRAAEPSVELAQQKILAPLSLAERAELMRLLAKLVELNKHAIRPARLPTEA
jgi:DNA-binding MarR family transcriptional regulator